MRPNCLAGAPIIGEKSRMRDGRPILFAIVLSLVAGGTPLRAAEPPYEGRLVRLAEVLGSLHYLRNLCGEKGNGWRSEMERLLETESPDTQRRARLVASFNRGYRSFDGTYASCTDSAVSAIDRYMREGQRLTREIVSQFGN